MLPLSADQVGAAPAPAPGAAADSSRDQAPRGHVINTPEWAKKYDAVNRAALEKRLRNGGKGAAQKVAKGQFGRVATTGKEKIFVVLAEFGDVVHPAVPSDPEQSDATTFVGPEHNEIPKPDRSVDNSTMWKANYNRSHYTNMYFNRMRKFYENESNGKYSFDGTVTEWVKVPYNEARYGRDLCNGVACSNTWWLVRDGLAYWVDAKLKSGWTLEQTVAREVMEEAGVRVRASRYLASQPWPFPSSLMLGFVADAEPDPPQADDELEDARWFTRDEVGAALRGDTRDDGLLLSPSVSISRWLIEAWHAGVSVAE